MKCNFIDLINDNIWTKTLVIQLVAMLGAFYINHKSHTWSTTQNIDSFGDEPRPYNLQIYYVWLGHHAMVRKKLCEPLEVEVDDFPWQYFFIYFWMFMHRLRRSILVRKMDRIILRKLCKGQKLNNEDTLPMCYWYLWVDHLYQSGNSKRV